MGKIKQGILGGFNGTTGSVVGASWKGIAYMRGKAQSIKNPRTTLQEANRSLFGDISDLMSKALSVVKVGFAQYASKRSEFNVAVKRNLDIVNSSGGDFDIVHCQFSDGPLTPIVDGSVAFSNNVISATSNFAAALYKDLTVFYVAVFSGDFVGAPFVISVDSVVRKDATENTSTLPTPSGVAYERCDVFAFFNDSITKESSLTTYLGEFTPE